MISIYHIRLINYRRNLSEKLLQRGYQFHLVNLFLHKDFFLSKEEDFYILWSLTVMKNKLFIDCSTREIKIKKENPVFVSLMSVQHFQRGCYVLINSK